MIIKPNVVAAMNDQIKSEFTASTQYIAIAVYFDDESLPDLASFFYRQAEEERLHAMKFVRFMLDAGVKPIIPSTSTLQNDFSSPSDAIQYALTQELKVTDQINNLVAIATTAQDYASRQFLQWFVTEQVEEVDSMSKLLKTIDHAAGNLLLVEEFVRRTATQNGAVGQAETAVVA